MMKVHSQDPRKKKIVAALKYKTGATKVTQVVQLRTGDFSGNCLQRVGDTLKFVCLGTHLVTPAECGLPDID